LRLALHKSERLALVCARVPMMHFCGGAFRTTCALPTHPLQRLGKRLAAEALRLLLRKLARTPGDPTISGSPSWWAREGGGTGRSGNPALLEASIPRWRMLLLPKQPGVLIDKPQ
jgi:hypothetical protein